MLLSSNCTESFIKLRYPFMRENHSKFIFTANHSINPNPFSKPFMRKNNWTNHSEFNKQFSIIASHWLNLSVISCLLFQWQTFLLNRFRSFGYLPILTRLLESLHRGGTFHLVSQSEASACSIHSKRFGKQWDWETMFT